MSSIQAKLQQEKNGGNHLQFKPQMYDVMASRNYQNEKMLKAISNLKDTMHQSAQHSIDNDSSSCDVEKLSEPLLNRNPVSIPEAVPK